MQFSNVLADFSGASQPGSETASGANEALEDEKLKSFEDGYSAGWDDAMKAQEERGKKLSSALHEAVANAKATQEDAFRAFSQSNSTFVSALLDVVFPNLATEVLSLQIKNLVSKYEADLDDVSFEVLVSPEQLEVFSKFVSEQKLEGVTVVARDAVLYDQVIVKFLNQEQQLDINALLDELRLLCSHILETTKEDT